ncbi:MAG: hypothetical protein KDH96_01835 [Candidatus Riesia sp.]|nr:hypothetical protein [Candidatus Riesia sp.]
MRTIKPKEIQVHHECICGLNITQTEYIPIKWNDFKAAGIKRITDVKTKKPFLIMETKSEKCYSCSLKYKM